MSLSDNHIMLKENYTVISLINPRQEFLTEYSRTVFKKIFLKMHAGTSKPYPTNAKLAQHSKLINIFFT